MKYRVNIESPTGNKGGDEIVEADNPEHAKTEALLGRETWTVIGEPKEIN